MNSKKLLLSLMAALALSLSACSDGDKAANNETKQEEQKAAEPSEKDQAAAKEIEAKLEKQEVKDGDIVAIVNNEELTGQQYNAALKSFQSQMMQSGQDPSSKDVAEQVKKQVLDSMVGQTLILQEAKKAKLEASEKEVTEQYQSFEEQYGGEDALAKALEEENLTLELFKAQIAESIVFEKYQAKFVPAKEVADKEIKDYYEQVAEQAKAAGQEFPPFDEAGADIKGMIKEQKQQEELTAHVEELKSKAKVELKI